MNALMRRFRPEQIRELVLVLLIILVIIFFATQIENYLSARFFNRISTSVAIIAVVAVGQTLVVLTRNIDLSVGSIVGFSSSLHAAGHIYIKPPPNTRQELFLSVYRL